MNVKLAAKANISTLHNGRSSKFVFKLTIRHWQNVHFKKNFDPLPLCRVEIFDLAVSFTFIDKCLDKCPNYLSEKIVSSLAAGYHLSNLLQIYYNFFIYLFVHIFQFFNFWQLFQFYFNFILILFQFLTII